MQRRVPEQSLRGSDITSLEIKTQDLLRKPVGQIAPVNVCDLFALADHPDVRGSFSTELSRFTDRIKQEVSDIPDGPSWKAFVEEFGAVAPVRVPESFRGLLRTECLRDDRNRSSIEPVLAGWEEVSPEHFEVVAAKPVIQKAAVRPVVESKRATRPSTRRPPRSVPQIDPERAATLKRLILERVNSRLENGLKEAVLIAGIRHRALSDYPDLRPNEIISVLKALKESGQLHYSAGRWKRVGAW